MSCLGHSGHDGPLKLSSVSKQKMGEILSAASNKAVVVKEFFQAPHEGTNDNFTSNISRLKVVSENDEVYHIIAKESKSDSGFWNTFFFSLNRFFFKEYIWYGVARPLLASTWPKVNELSPNIYYGNVNTGTTLEKSWCQETFGPFGLMFKNEKIALSAVRSMAHFHGIWKRFLYGKAHFTPDNSFTSPKDFVSHFETDYGTWSYHKLLAPFKAMCRDLIINNFSTEIGAGEYLASVYMSYMNSEKADKLLEELYTNTKADNSKLKTMNHGDSWTNNMLYRESDDSVTLLDFQLMQISHPAKDFWYFIYSCTDQEMRKGHLEEIKMAYYEVYSSYLAPNFEMTYEEVSAELENRRGICLFLAMVCVMVSKYPEPIASNQLLLHGPYKKMMRLIADKEKAEDHPAIKNIRKLILETVTELSNLGVLRKNKHI
ncbi:Putative LOC100203980 [Caligus rogercresseyi]|uniref:LOC100203980 n=1 Tax=Caligus rogercresseyi TaxID=217165 RepID=A0A7T8HLP8_CALRO|nr:Putative LOC100203980 [Caligus rogercresseyi]